LLNVTRGRYEYPRLRATAIALAQKFRPQYVLIEDASTGVALSQELGKFHLGAAVKLVPMERDKIGRLYVHQAKFEAGLVHFPRGAAFSRNSKLNCFTFRTVSMTTRSTASVRP
jgi:phage terminase large subunit-like protein